MSVSRAKSHVMCATGQSVEIWRSFLREFGLQKRLIHSTREDVLDQGL